MNREGEPLSSVVNAYISFFFGGNTAGLSLETPQETWRTNRTNRTSGERIGHLVNEQDTVPAMRPARIPGLPSRVVRTSEITS